MLPGLDNTPLADEVEAINSIYGRGSIDLIANHDPAAAQRAILHLPDHPVSFTLEFEQNYPDTPPIIKGVNSVADGGAKGEGRTAEGKLSCILQKIWTPGQVCLFDLIEEAQANVEDQEGETDGEYGEQDTVINTPVGIEAAETVAFSDMPSSTMYGALIRTHHITSRKKVATLKAAAKQIGCAALLRSGGSPGVMYVESRNKDSVKKWVDTVHELRYKDYQLVSPTAVLPGRAAGADDLFAFQEVESVKEFGAKMEEKGILEWWRKAMGYVSN